VTDLLVWAWTVIVLAILIGAPVGLAFWLLDDWRKS
jgi:hypothetical protein